MKKEITEEESRKIDLILKFLLTFKDKNYLPPSNTPFIFKEYGITDIERVEYICEKLSILKVFELKHEGKFKLLVHFSKDRITEFLANGGMTDIWLNREEKRVNIRLINKTLKDYFWTKFISWFSFGIAVILAILELIQWKNK